MRPERVAGSSPARCRFHTSRSVLVTPASAARMNSTACAFGSRLSVSSGSVPIAFNPGVSRMTSPCCSSGCGKLMTACRQHGMSTAPSPSDFERRQEILVLVEAVLARQRDRHALHLRHARQRLAHPVGVRQVERNRHPFVGVVLELGDRRVLRAASRSGAVGSPARATRRREARSGTSSCDRPTRAGAAGRNRRRRSR